MVARLARPFAVPEKPMMPSPEPPADSEIVSESVCARLLAASASVRAGTRTWASADEGSPGLQVSSRTASRYRSVAARVSFSPSISIRTPVSIGSVSSRPAATATCATAAANSAPATVPAVVGMAGSVG